MRATSQPSGGVERKELTIYAHDADRERRFSPCLLFTMLYWRGVAGWAGDLMVAAEGEAEIGTGGVGGGSGVGGAFAGEARPDALRDRLAMRR